MNLLPYYFFTSKYTCAAYFCTGFAPDLHRFCTGFVPDFSQKSKKICQFFAIFSRCVSTS